MTPEFPFRVLAECGPLVYVIAECPECSAVAAFEKNSYARASEAQVRAALLSVKSSGTPGRTIPSLPLVVTPL